MIFFFFYLILFFLFGRRDQIIWEPCLHFVRKAVGQKEPGDWVVGAKESAKRGRLDPKKKGKKKKKKTNRLRKKKENSL